MSKHIDGTEKKRCEEGKNGNSDLVLPIPKFLCYPVWTTETLCSQHSGSLALKSSPKARLCLSLFLRPLEHYVLCALMLHEIIWFNVNTSQRSWGSLPQKDFLTCFPTFINFWHLRMFKWTRQCAHRKISLAQATQWSKTKSWYCIFTHTG